MTTRAEKSKPSPSPERPSGDSAVAPSGNGTPLVTADGTTSIGDSVVQKIVGVTVRAIPGVHGLGGSGARTFGSIRQRIPGSGGPSLTQGVAVEVGERQAAVDLNIVVDYGAPILELSQLIRRDVIAAVEGMTGLSVSEVNISVDDIYVADDGEDTDDGEPARVQ